MAPIKFEEDIRERLEKRELQPSADVWQKLSNRLDAEPKRKRNISYWRLGIAASFAGLIMVSSILFLKSSDTNINTPALVEEETVKTVEETELINTVTEEESIQKSQIVLEELEKEGKNQKKEFTPVNVVVVETKNDQLLVMEENATEDTTTKVLAFKETAIASTVDSIQTIEQKMVDEVVAEIQKLQEEKSTVTDAEIDALLHQAQKELTSKHLYDASTKIVDAELLLLQVETDLDQSFRDRVFEVLNSGYKKVRTAVAERNN